MSVILQCVSEASEVSSGHASCSVLAIEIYYTLTGELADWVNLFSMINFMGDLNAGGLWTHDVHTQASDT